MSIDSRAIQNTLRQTLQDIRPAENLLTGFQAGQGLVQNQQNLLRGDLQNQALQQSLAQQQAQLPIEQQLLEQRLVAGEQGLATGELQQQQIQATLDALGVPDVPTAKQLAFNTAKLAAITTTEGKIEQIQSMKQTAISQGRSTNNLDELEQAFNVSEEAGSQLLNAGVQAFQQTGLLTPQEEQEAKQQSLDIRKQELALKQQIESRQKTKLSGVLESSLLASQEAVVKAQQSSTEFDILANQVEDAELSGGIASTTTETFKRLLGSQDDVTELRRRFNKVRLSEGLKNLPPGPATDKDMEQAFKGVPPENAPASQIASFLRGAAKMSRFDAGYNQFKSDFISEKSTAKGLNKEWRKSVTSSVLERDITIAEIYAEAAAEGVTPEEVKAELGIQ